MFYEAKNMCFLYERQEKERFFPYICPIKDGTRLACGNGMVCSGSKKLQREIEIICRINFNRMQRN